MQKAAKERYLEEKGVYQAGGSPATAIPAAVVCISHISVSEV